MTKLITLVLASLLLAGCSFSLPRKSTPEVRQMIISDFLQAIPQPL